MDFLKPVTAFRVDSIDNWVRFKTEFSALLRSIESVRQNKLEENEKVALLLNQIGKDALEIIMKKFSESDLYVVKDFNDLLFELEKLWGTSSIIHKTNTETDFGDRFQKHNETVDDYIFDLRKKMVNKHHVYQQDEVLKNQLMKGVLNEQLRGILSKECVFLSLRETLKICRNFESEQFTKERFKKLPNGNKNFLNIQPQLLATTVVNVNVLNLNIEKLATLFQSRI